MWDAWSDDFRLFFFWDFVTISFCVWGQPPLNGRSNAVHYGSLGGLTINGRAWRYRETVWGCFLERYELLGCTLSGIYAILVHYCIWAHLWVQCSTQYIGMMLFWCCNLVSGQLNVSLPHYPTRGSDITYTWCLDGLQGRNTPPPTATIAPPILD